MGDADIADLAARLAPLAEILERGRLRQRVELWQAPTPRAELPPPCDLPPLSELGDDVLRVDRLLLCGEALDAGELLPLLGRSCLDALVEHHLLRHDGDGSLQRGLLPWVVGGHLVFADGEEHPMAGGRDPVHIGPDSLLLYRLVAGSGRVGRALDLCAGSGVIALGLSARARSVTAVELSPCVAAVAQLNLALAGLQGPVEIRVGDSMEMVSGERYDLVASNPPFAPAASESPGDLASAGGPDGLEQARRIWSGSPDLLEAGGECWISMAPLGDAKAPHCEEEWRRLAQEAELAVSYLASQAPLPFHAERASGPRYTRALRASLETARRTGATHRHPGVLTILRGGEPGFRRVRLHVDAERWMAAQLRALRARRSS